MTSYFSKKKEKIKKEKNPEKQELVFLSEILQSNCGVYIH